MTQHDDLVYLGHMLDTAKKVVGKTRARSRAEFDANEDLRLALVHLIQVVGEAGRKVSDRTKQEHPEIPWAKIVGMRHRVVHDYMQVDEDIVWEVSTVHLPELVEQLRRFVPDDPVA